MFYLTFEIATHGIPPLMYVHGFNFIIFLQIFTFVYALIIKRFTLIKFLTIQNNLHTCVATITEPSCITSSVALSRHMIATTFAMAYTC